MPLIVAILAFPCGAVLGRCLGGFIGLGDNMTNLTRLLYGAVPGAAFVAGLTFPMLGERNLLLPVLVCAALWLGQLGIPRCGDLPGGHGWCQERGALNYAGMAATGLWRGALLALALAYWLPSLAGAVALSGILRGAGYAIGWECLDGKELIKWHPRNPKAPDGSGFDRFAISGGEWGEALSGGLIWGAWALILFPWG